jgi:hypothetical protein
MCWHSIQVEKYSRVVDQPRSVIALNVPDGPDFKMWFIEVNHWFEPTGYELEIIV